MRLIPVSALMLALGLSLPLSATEIPAPRTLVEIDGKAITELHFAVYQQERGHAHSEQDQVDHFNELINTMMIARAAEKEGLGEHPEIVASIDLYRAKLLAQASIQDRMKKTEISDDAINAAYKAKYSGDTGSEYKARHILLKNEEDAKGIIQQLDKGADFAALAKEHSKGPSGASGGDLGWFQAGQMVKPFSDAVASMKKGEYSKAPVQTQFGWHVILLEDTRKAEPPKLDAVRDELVAELKRKEVMNYVQGLQKTMKIEFKGTEAK